MSGHDIADELTAAMGAVILKVREDFSRETAALRDQVSALQKCIIEQEEMTCRALSDNAELRATLAEYAKQSDLDPLIVEWRDASARYASNEDIDAIKLRVDQSATSDELESLQSSLGILLDAQPTRTDLETLRVEVTASLADQAESVSASLFDIESRVSEAVSISKLAAIDATRHIEEDLLTVIDQQAQEQQAMRSLLADLHARVPEHVLPALHADLKTLTESVASTRQDIDRLADAPPPVIPDHTDAFAAIHATLADIAGQIDRKADTDFHNAELATVREAISSAATLADLGALRSDIDLVATRSSADLTTSHVALQDQIETRASELSTSLSSLTSRFDNAMDVFYWDLDAIRSDISDSISPLERAIATAASEREQLRADLIDRYSRVEPWARGGEAYKEQALVTHRGGTWQAVNRAHGEPGSSDDWLLIADGLAEIATDANDDTATIRFVMTSGRTTEISHRQPVPRFRGVYDPNADYAPWDSVAKDSSIFIATVQHPTAAPGEVFGEWNVFSGPRGKRGAKGESAPVSDPRALIPEVVKAAVDELVPLLQNALNASR